MNGDMHMKQLNQINLRISDRLKEELTEHAKSKGITTAELIKNLMRKEVRK